MRNVRFSQQRKSLIYKLVPGAGIEPARLAAGDFESPASTNFTTRAGSRRQIVAPEMDRHYTVFLAAAARRRQSPGATSCALRNVRPM